LIRASIRTGLALGFYCIMIPIAALVGFPTTLITGRIDFLYRFAMWIVRTGVRLAGVRVEVMGREHLDLSRNYIFMANHVSNADPPILVPNLPRRTSVLVKRELFRVPLLGAAMRMASLVAIDRSNKEAAIASMRRAAEVLRSGLDMTVFPEGTRSLDGRLLPFKKGPFHMAMETGVPIVPVTIVGTHDILPKGQVRIRPGTARLIFHLPIDPTQFGERDALIAAVRDRVASGLPVEKDFSG
jgi:1-acyl-sn-glycerol-3-phosphate acyltransferase